MRAPSRSARYRLRSVVIAAVAVAAVTTLAACGENEETGAGAGGAVAVKDIAGVGTTLVDANGKTLYFAEQEAKGSIACVAACLGFWFPVDGAAASTDAVPGLATVQRPDTGKDQLTFDGKPLYTFKLDSAPGDHEGHNLDDTFGGTRFTWRAATTAAAPSTSTQPAEPNDPYGY